MQCYDGQMGTTTTELCPRQLFSCTAISLNNCCKTISSCSTKSGVLPASITSQCLPNGKWSTAELSSKKSLNISLENNFWPSPDQSDLVCGCASVRVPYDPNKEEGAEFYCSEDGKNVDTSSGVTLRTGVECELYCDRRLAVVVSCDGGVWSGQPEEGFYCYHAPQVERGPPGVQGSCSGHCGEGAGGDRACYCDTQCSEVGDCCGDYVTTCTVVITSCQGRCQVHHNTEITTRQGCQCDSLCYQQGDCCDDFMTVCYSPIVASTPSHSGNTV